MGIHFLKYISEIFQIIAIMFWTGSLIVIVFILYPQINRFKENKKIITQIFVESIHKIEYFLIIAIILLWSGILIYLTTAASNPLKSKIYILHILLSGIMSVFTLLKIFWIQHTIVKSEKSLRLFSQPELQNAIDKKLDNYNKAYYFLSVVNLVIIFTIILLNQF